MPPNYRLVRDVTYPPDSQVFAEESFSKAWRIENNGDVSWGPGFRLSHVNGRAMTPETTVDLPACAPGEQVEIAVNLTAPAVLGSQFSDWRLRDSSGEFFGDILWTRLKVVPRPAGGTSDFIFMADVTIPDDQKMAQGAAFVKTWCIKNTGTLPLGPSHTLNFLRGVAMTTQTSVPMPFCAPGQQIEVSLALTAPDTAGHHKSEWQVRDAQGKAVGVLLWLTIVVTPEGGRVVERAEKPKPKIDIAAPHYSQRDSRWRSKVLGASGSPVTIGSWGCLLTCLAMTTSSFGHSITPSDLNDLLLQKGGFWKGYFTSWDALATVYGDVVFEGKEDQHPTIVTRIDTALASQCPVPVLVDRTPENRYNDNDQHWVLVVARNGDNDYWINDPVDLEAEPVSMMERYGRPDGLLRSAVLSALFYRKR